MADKRPPKQRRAVQLFVALLVLVASANAVVWFLQRQAYTIVTVSGSSMSPTVQSGDRIAVDRRTKFDDVQRGDLVVVRIWDSDAKASAQVQAPSAGDPDSQLVVKRVIGLPGERVEIRSQTVAIDDVTRLKEPYARWGDTSPTVAPMDLADDELFILGDNRPESRDSRSFGPVTKAAYVGSANLRIWPPSGFGSVKSSTVEESNL